ncbi:MAG TPA: GtrA family protein [Rhizomicrobium sp.]|nr:GtrA family protein [Rhizomicrobium sp.]
MRKLLGFLSRLSILRFAVIGALGVPVDWCVLQLMVHWGYGPYAGRILSWFCAATFTWAGNRYFTFAGARAHGILATAQEWLRFLAANAVGGLVNVGLYSVLVRFAPPPFNDLTIALVLGVLLGLVFNFTLSKKLVFQNAGKRDAGQNVPFQGP